MADSILPENILWHIRSTERELSKYYGAATNAITRITCLEIAVSHLLDKLKIKSYGLEEDPLFPTMVIGSFQPHSEFNLCDHCQYMYDRKDSDLPCRTCPLNTNYKYYKSLDGGK